MTFTTQFGPKPPTIEDQSGTAISRRLAVAGVVLLGAVGPGPPRAHAAAVTGVARFTNATAEMAGTSLRTVSVDGPVEPFVRPTTMGRIRDLAPLSLRDWARVFGVSHTAIREWLRDDSPRQKLTDTLAALEEAYRIHPDLRTWLTSPVAGLEIKPIDLLRDDRWRAFRGAIRAQAATASGLLPADVAARRRAETSWAVTDVEITPDKD